MKIEQCRKCKDYDHVEKESFYGSTKAISIEVLLIFCKKVNDYLLVCDREIYKCPKENK